MGGAISWRSCLQGCKALCTIKAKYIAISEAYKEVVWLSRLSCGMGILQLVPRLLYDNQSVIILVKNLVYHEKTKHIGLWYHFIWDCLHWSLEGWLLINCCRCIEQSLTTWWIGALLSLYGCYSYNLPILFIIFGLYWEIVTYNVWEKVKNNNIVCLG